MGYVESPDAYTTEPRGRIQFGKHACVIGNMPVCTFISSAFGDKHSPLPSLIADGVQILKQRHTFSTALLI